MSLPMARSFADPRNLDCESLTAKAADDFRSASLPSVPHFGARSSQIARRHYYL
jgi:hypothetical protein